MTDKSNNNTGSGLEDEEGNEIAPYSMHVSAKYLELTRKKLELTRLPRELEIPEQRRWELGTPKDLLEPLLDYWLEHYDWRTQETHFNTALPQYRTTICIPSASYAYPSPFSTSSRRTNAITNNTNTIANNNASSSSTETPLPTPILQTEALRIHFVHKPSKHPNALPLLFCHTWPSSFIEVERIIEALTDPHSLPSFGAGASQAFHVVAPSIPGFGFSDASASPNFGLRETAEVFHRLMERLGYERYVAHGSGWGFNICRVIAVKHPESCMAVHTTNPTFSEPTLRRSPVAFLKYRVAKLTRAKIPFLSFGYVPTEIQQQEGQQRKVKATQKKLTKALSSQRRTGGDLALIQAAAANSGTTNNQDLVLLHSSYRPLELPLHGLYSLRPHTLAFSLCDSPIGLLAGLLDIIHARTQPYSPLASRSRSPFLSPVELEMQDSQQLLREQEQEQERKERELLRQQQVQLELERQQLEQERRRYQQMYHAQRGGRGRLSVVFEGVASQSSEQLHAVEVNEVDEDEDEEDDLAPRPPPKEAHVGRQPGQEGGEQQHSQDANARSYIWSPTEVLNWTMMQWLPGPEASLRWLRRAQLESSISSSTGSHSSGRQSEDHSQQKDVEDWCNINHGYCPVPLGISSFRGRNGNHNSSHLNTTSSSSSGDPTSPLMWGSASWQITWVKRHHRSASLAAWEAPDLTVLDMRECFGSMKLAAKLDHGTGGQ